MRELTEHKTNPVNDVITINVLDEPGPGNANHVYTLDWHLHEGTDLEVGEPDDHRVTLRFQNGPINEVGVNGITNEALLAVLIDRMRGFQSGPYNCEANAIALTALEKAQDALRDRTKARMERGVEGTMAI